MKAHSYIYGDEMRPFTFYRIPKAIFTDDEFSSMSIEARFLYGFLLDRVSLSQSNGWIDEQKRVFIIYTVEEVMAVLHCGNKKAGRLLRELETRFGIIERRKQGFGKPNIIYVKSIAPMPDCQDQHSG